MRTFAILWTLASVAAYAADCGTLPAFKGRSDAPTSVELATGLQFRNPFILIQPEGDQKGTIVFPVKGVFAVGPFPVGKYVLHVNGWGDVKFDVTPDGVNLPYYYRDVIQARALDKNLPASVLCPTFSASSN